MIVHVGNYSFKNQIHFQVYAWGLGSCLGDGSSSTALRPKLVEDLQNTRIVDISCGDSHCLALTHGT